MIIGIDASHLDPNNISGTQKYLINLLIQLSKIDDKNTYIVYLKYDLNDKIKNELSLGENFIFKKLISRLSWTQRALSSQLFRDNCDVLVCPWQTMPIIHPKDTIIVSIIHGLEYKKMQFGPTMYSCYFSDILIAVSEFTQSQISKKFFINKNKINVIYEGINTTQYQPVDSNNVTKIKDKYGIKNDFLFFVGSLVPRKNLANTIKAFSELFYVRGLSKIELVIAGGGSSNHLVTIAKEHNIHNNVKFIGRVPDSDLPALLSGARALVYVSYSEGFGLPVLESLACNTPVITSSTGALKEVGGDCAYYINNPNDIDEIANGMYEVLTDDSLRGELLANSKTQVSKFNWEDTAYKLLALIGNHEKKN